MKRFSMQKDQIEALDWMGLVNDLLAKLILSQSELGKRCEVAQQTVGNWKCGTRNPGHRAKRALLSLLDENGMNVDRYRLSEEPDSKYPHTDGVSQDDLFFARLQSVAERLDEQAREALLDYARYQEWRSAATPDRAGRGKNTG